MTPKARREALAQKKLDAKILSFVVERKAKGQSANEIAEAVFQRLGYLVKRITQTQIVLHGVKGRDWIIEMPKQNPKKSAKKASAAQIAWRKKFAEKVKAGAFKKAAKKRRALGRKSPAKKRNAASWWKVTGTDARGNSHHKLAKTKAECRAYAKKHGLKNVKISEVKPSGTVANPKRNTTIIRAKKIEHLDVSRIHSLGKTENLKKNPAYAIHRTLKATTRGNQPGWLLGKKFYAKSRGQKSLPGGSVLDLNSGLVYSKVANPKRKTAKKKNIAGFMQDGVFHPIRSGVEQRTVKGKKKLVKSKKDYKPSKVGEKHTYSAKKSAKRAAQSRRMTAATKQRKATTSRLASRSLHRSYPLKGKRRNPDTPAQLLEQFRGYPKDRDDNLRFPNGTPSGLYKLGTLKKIVTTHNTINMPSNQVWLCADTKGKLYVGGVVKSAAKGRVVNAPAGPLGKVQRVEYVEKKPHLGDNEKTLYFHKMGEEDGIKPTLYSDGDGNLLFKGGNYQVTYRGIVN